MMNKELIAMCAATLMAGSASDNIHERNAAKFVTVAKAIVDETEKLNTTEIDIKKTE